jgi:hypothetical protein
LDRGQVGADPAAAAGADRAAKSELIGADAVHEIEASGAIWLHAVGDTGRPDVHNPNQDGVADQMAADYGGVSGRGDGGRTTLGVGRAASPAVEEGDDLLPCVTSL